MSAIRYRSFLPYPRDTDIGERRLIYVLVSLTYIADFDGGFDMQPFFGLLRKIRLQDCFRPKADYLRYWFDRTYHGN